MPEAPEIRIMSEFINYELGYRDVVKVEKSPLSKNKCDLSILNEKKWKVTSKSRGKEMILTFYNDTEKHHLKIGFARIGSLVSRKVSELDTLSAHKNGGTFFDREAILRIYTSDDMIFYVSDFTRYTIWRWCGEWDTRRSPDISLEHNDWRLHLYRHRKIPHFEKPIFELMNDQRFFNGIGNFTRSEILYRTTFSPFTPFKEILEHDNMRNEFFDICRSVLEEIYVFGGLQFQHWKNPFGVSNSNFIKWQSAYERYNNCYLIKDSNSRNFWCKISWKNHHKVYNINREA